MPKRGQDIGSVPFVVSFVVNLVDSSTRVPTKFAINFTIKNNRYQIPNLSRRSSKSEGGCRIPDAPRSSFALRTSHFLQVPSPWGRKTQFPGTNSQAFEILRPFVVRTSHFALRTFFRLPVQPSSRLTTACQKLRQFIQLITFSHDKDRVSGSKNS